MATATERAKMAKHRTPPEGEPAQEPEKVTTTKVRHSLLHKARAIAAHRGIDLFDYLDGLLTSLIERDYRATIRDEYRKLGEDK